ncbi:MAG: hypothetical protein WCA07_00530 [Gloeobacterales cyanobacterium]
MEPCWSSKPSYFSRDRLCESHTRVALCLAPHQPFKAELQQAAYPSSRYSDRPKTTTYLLSVDPPVPSLRSDFDLDLLKTQNRQNSVQKEKLLAQSIEQTSPPPYQDRPQKNRYKRSRRQVRSLSVQAIGTATLGSLSIAKAFEADPHKNNWLSPLVFAIAMVSAAFYFLGQKPRRRNDRIKDTDLLRVTQTLLLPAPREDSERKSIQATAEIYWNKRLYKGRATEIGPQNMRVEIDDVIRGLKILMPVGLIISQDDRIPPQHFLVQVVSIQPLAIAGNHRYVLELRFPNRWQQQQDQKVKELIDVLN